MLTKFEVRNLFGLYSYSLNFHENAENGISILTGPNGYGKTTILNLINAIYAMDKRALCECPYETFTVYFDGVVLTCKQRRIPLALEEESDVVLEDDVVLEMAYFKEGQSNPMDTFVIRKTKDGVDGTFPGTFELFVRSRFLRYITDDRLILLKTDTVLSESAIKSETLYSYAKNLSQRFRQEGVANSGHDRVANELAGNVELFQKVINKFHFSDKEMVISPLFGFRFKHLRTGEFIPLAKLSSGEKHLLIQTYSLVFDTPADAVALIDEPEISLHPAWIVQYIDNLQEIQKFKSRELERPFQIIIATHSPILIGQRWKMTMDLYELSER